MTLGNKKFLATALVTAATVAASAIPSQAQMLTQEEIATEIIGQTLTSRRMGMTARMTLLPDGTAQLQVPIGRGEGTWSFNGNQVCMNMRMRGREQNQCTTYERVGANEFRTSEGNTVRIQ